jgi:hypothetical protein
LTPGLTAIRRLGDHLAASIKAAYRAVPVQIHQRVPSR